jgi:hypothetical protein
MGVREALNSHRGLTIGLALGMLSLAVGFGIWTIFAGNETVAGGTAWFSDDDGKTWFKDDPKKITPFDHNGKQAVMCFVYTKDGGKTQFVAYLMRHQLGWKEKAEGIRHSGKDANLRDRMTLMSPPMEVKKPGDSEWVLITDPRGQAITDPREIRADPVDP